MYSTCKVITGLIIFLVLFSFPAWYSVASGKAAYAPEPKVPDSIGATGTQCVEATEYMKVKHMDLLADWKDSVVRQGIRTYVASDGREYRISLTETCLDCHSNKSEFCDQCHDYVGVKPNCWDCHVIPERTSK